MDVQEGTISVDGYQVWYRRVGSGGIPLLLLHGGPGAGHDYLEPLEALAADRQIVFYDQLGCGRSDQPDDRSLWRMERFVAEVDTVRRALHLEQMHLLGSVQYACKKLHACSERVGHVSLASLANAS
jgi:proline-specific peptidase